MRTLPTKVLFNLILIGILVWFALPSEAVSQRTNTDFSPSYRLRETALSLSGVGVLKYFGFISIYNGALYLPPDIRAEKALDDIPKRLEVKYLRSFKAKDFGPATIAGMKNNVDPGTYQQLESRIAYHNALYEDIAPGDRVSLTYTPSVGTMLEINGIPKGTITGADFAEALFSMWLGEKPFDDNFKRALLGEK